MSASREKKKRQEYLAANGGVDPKATREAERLAAEKKSKILYSGIAAVFVVVAIALLVFNSGVIQRNRAAVVIDGEKYTAADVSYYYYNAYQSFMSSGYGSYFINTTQPLSSQKCVFNAEMTWADYFKEEAVNNLKLVHAAAKAAKAENMVLGEEEKETFASNIEYMKAQAEVNNYSYKDYLAAVFGSYMTPDIFEEQLELTLLANMYTSAHYDSLVYTDDEILAYYEENKNTYDTVDGAYVAVSGKPEAKKDEEGNTIEATDEEKSAALAEAKNTADTLLAGFNAGDDLKALAEALKATYTGDTELTYSDSTALNWLFDESRVAGDTEIVLDKETSTYYVLVFNSREREDALDYNVRHILVTEKNLDLAEGEKAEDSAIELAAQAILDEWDGTEEGFAALAEKYSQDTGSVANGGLYENVNKGDMVTEFNDWCYAEGRKTGDVEIVKTSYGYHIMYFVSYGTTEYWHNACQTALASEAYTTWETALRDSVTAETKGGMSAIA